MTTNPQAVKATRLPGKAPKSPAPAPAPRPATPNVAAGKGNGPDVLGTQEKMNGPLSKSGPRLVPTGGQAAVGQVRNHRADAGNFVSEKKVDSGLPNRGSHGEAESGVEGQDSTQVLRTDVRRGHAGHDRRTSCGIPGDNQRAIGASLLPPVLTAPPFTLRRDPLPPRAVTNSGGHSRKTEWRLRAEGINWTDQWFEWVDAPRTAAKKVSNWRGDGIPVKGHTTADGRLIVCHRDAVVPR